MSRRRRTRMRWRTRREGPACALSSTPTNPRDAPPRRLACTENSAKPHADAAARNFTAVAADEASQPHLGTAVRSELLKGSWQEKRTREFSEGITSSLVTQACTACSMYSSHPRSSYPETQTPPPLPAPAQRRNVVCLAAVSSKCNP
jgi:hypothetical protein